MCRTQIPVMYLLSEIFLSSAVLSKIYQFVNCSYNLLIRGKQGYC